MSKHYTNLSLNERIHIQTLHERGIKLRAIARNLMRAPSTISRELARNKGFATVPTAANKRPASSRYIASQAQTIRDTRRSVAKQGVRRIPPSWDTPLAKFVRHDLAHGWSPAQVSGRLKLAYPKLASMQASTETIYASIYIVARGALRSELIAQLRQAHQTRMPRARGKARKSTIVNAVPICERPAVVDERITPGHWEGDFIKGAYNRSAVGTLVERQSRFLLLSAVGGCTAQHALDGFTKRLLTVPTPLRQTLTYDNGSEMAQHEQLAKNVDMDIYFCEPYSPWQRGSNENMNGLVRQYLPKGMDLSSVTPQALRYIEDSLNNRPRKILQFRTPREVFNALKSGMTFEQAINIDVSIKGVALQA